MTKNITKHRRDDIEYMEDDGEIAEFLDVAASFIGRIVIELNSLEDNVSFQIKELMSSSEYQDDMVFVFLAEMPYSKKVSVLAKLLGQEIDASCPALRPDLDDLGARLLESGRRRNQYAHASWEDVGEGGLIMTRIKAKRTGVYHTYRKFDEAIMRDDLDYISATQDDLDYLILNLDEQRVAATSPSKIEE